jgi:hypothetical protein
MFRSSDGIEKLQKWRLLSLHRCRLRDALRLQCRTETEFESWTTSWRPHTSAWAPVLLTAETNPHALTFIFCISQFIHWRGGGGSSRRDFRKTCRNKFTAHVWKFSKHCSCRFRLQCYRYIRRVILRNSHLGDHLEYLKLISHFTTNALRKRSRLQWPINQLNNNPLTRQFTPFRRLTSHSGKQYLPNQKTN